MLFLFVIMLLNVGQEPRRASGGRLERWSALVGALAFGGILIGLQSGGPTPPQVPLTPEDVALRPLAVTLFTEYLLVFEIAGVLLLAAVVAATVLARRPTAEERGGDA